MNSETWHSTTIIGVRRNGKVAMASDGQVTMGETIIKRTAKKIRKLHHDKVLVGFAGATADAFTLFERFEGKVNEFGGDIVRASVELAKEWRTDRVLRRLEAMLVVLDKKSMFLLSGTGDLIEPDEPVLGIGSGGAFAQAAAKALLRHTPLPPREVAAHAMRIAAEICIYTNDTLTIEEL